MKYYISFWLMDKVSPTTFEVTETKYEGTLHNLRSLPLPGLMEFKNSSGDVVFIVTRNIQTIIFETVDKN